MRKEIKIAGLENINALSESAEGTVFRGKRVMEMETIIKVLPYPVNLSNKEEQNTAVYLREIKRLKYLNQVPNIHVVKIINTGLTDQDALPFIETEFIKGPDLDGLLSFPNNPIFKVDDVIALATQMADALAHCHKAMVKHGRINSNNIRLNSETGSYILLNFGRTLLTDEQRAAEFKHSRASEYLAPEQLRGEILFETDIYSLGVILFQLLTGTLPQKRASAENRDVPLTSIGQQIKELRKENLPVSWTDEEKSQELNIPVWLLNTVAICLQEDPSKRYGNGLKLQEALKLNADKAKGITSPNPIIIPLKSAEIKGDKTETTPSVPVVTPPKPADIKEVKTASTPPNPVVMPPKPADIKEVKTAATAPAPVVIPPMPDEIKEDKTGITTPGPVVTPPKTAEIKEINTTTEKPQDTDEKDAEIKRLKSILIQKEGQLDVYKYQTADYNPDSKKLSISKPVLITLIALLVGLAAFAAYAYFFRKPDTKGLVTTYTDSDTTTMYGDEAQYKASERYDDSLYKIDSAALVRSLPPIPESEKTNTKDSKKAKEENKPIPAVKKPAVKTAAKKPEAKPAYTRTSKSVARNSTAKTPSTVKPEPKKNPEYVQPKVFRPATVKYTLAVPKAYFYDKPDVRSRRPVYLANTNDSELTASEDTNGFIYVVFFNTEREITKGWLRKADLRQIN